MRSLVGLCGAWCLLAASVAAAQPVGATAPVRVGLRGGISIPVGDFASTDPESGFAATTGFDLAALIAVRRPGWPVALRAEATYDRFGVDDDVIGDDPDLQILADAHWSIIAGTLGVELPVPLQGAARPYLIGGVGYYQYRLTVDAGAFGNVSLDDRDFGLNGGGGLRFRASGLDAFVEARVHSIFASFDGVDKHLNYVPISLGFLF